MDRNRLHDGGCDPGSGRAILRGNKLQVLTPKHHGAGWIDHHHLGSVIDKGEKHTKIPLCPCLHGLEVSFLPRGHTAAAEPLGALNAVHELWEIKPILVGVPRRVRAVYLAQLALKARVEDAPGFPSCDLADVAALLAVDQAKKDGIEYNEPQTVRTLAPGG